MDRASQGLVISLCVHAVLVWILLHADWEAPLSQNDTTEVVLIERETKKEQTFVTDPNNRPDKPITEKLSDQADFISAFTERVKKQIVARNNGETRNALPKQAPKGDPEGIAGQEQRGLDGDGFLAPGGGMQQPIPNVAIGDSSISEYIPGIEEGAFTALNTDQFTYYAFFARMNEQVRNRWIAGIREYMASLTRDQMMRVTAANRQTVIEILLTRTGEFAGGIVHNSSGDTKLDQTTVRAFRRAAPFPNPPQEMVEKDDLIHLKYGFMIRFRPSGFGPGT